MIEEGFTSEMRDRINRTLPLLYGLFELRKREERRDRRRVGRKVCEVKSGSVNEPGIGDEVYGRDGSGGSGISDNGGEIKVGEFSKVEGGLG